MIEQFIASLLKSFGKLSTEQIDSAKQIIYSFQTHEGIDKRQLAYILATAWHESKLTPIKEIKGKPLSKLWLMYQSRYWNTGYYGRGFVQLTWKKNYELFSKILGIDLINNPDMALETKYAAEIIVIGMLKGLFTGVGLYKYFNSEIEDPVNARRIVNGKDKAELITSYYNLIIENI